MAKTDRTYHHGDLRQTLVEAACQHLVESGADTLSLRALARQVGVSQTAPYRHFESKNALFAAVATYGFEQMRAAVKATQALHPDNIELAFVEMGLTYVTWATENPEKYSLFFDSSLLDFSEHPELMAAGSACFQVVVDLIQSGVEQGVFIDKPVIQLAGSTWASFHGCASLLLHKSTMIEFDDDENVAIQAIRMLSEDTRATMELMVKALKIRD